MKFIGIDTGGTFTDFVYYDGGRLRVHKVLSTPHAPEEAILQGMGDLGLDMAGLRVVHGSTVATNAVLEGKGVRTVYIGNHGLGDLLTIGRQARRELYDLQPSPQQAPVPPELCLETGGRLGADGDWVEPLTERDLTRLLARLEALRPRAVAINLLFSYLDDRAERVIAERMPPGIFVSRSSEVLAQTGEFERGIATWLNAWIGPLVEGYLQRLSRVLVGSRVAVMQSSGATIAAGQAGRQAVRLLLSGPAAGLVGARFSAELAGRGRLLTFDMGGTSTDVALLAGAPRLTSEGRIGPYPVAVPMVDMHTIGAGGGSIACLDSGGMLQVGPESAGAAPGPACYGRGGGQATVTDANLLLGRLRPEAFLGGRMHLDERAARRAMEPLARAIKLPPEQVALGILRVANEHMSRALRVISVQRGVDPRSFTLVSFGGAGGLHVCALAESLGMRQALVPVHAGVLSALGMLVTPPGRQLSRTWLTLLSSLDENIIQQRLDALAADGFSSLAGEGVAASAIRRSDSLDLRYQGQSWTLNVRWSDISGVVEAFAEQHRQRYGHRLDLPLELVNLRVGLTGSPSAFSPSRQREDGPESGGPVTSRVRMYGLAEEVPVIDRGSLRTDRIIHGPAVIIETVATTWLATGWRSEVDEAGNLLLQRC